jgi:glycosyltransferase involved in cell wall biosynthesis
MVHRLKHVKSCLNYDLEPDWFLQKNEAGLFAKDVAFARMVYPGNLSVGVLIPARNEEKNIEDVILRLKNLGFENILVIDGQSKDATPEMAKKHGAIVVSQTNLGKGNAVRQVLANGYLDVDALVLMDADGSMAPEEIPALIEALASGADVAKGSRFLKGGNTYDMNLTRRIGNGFMMVGVNILFSTKYTDLCYGFAAFNKRAIKALAPILKSENFEIEAEIFIKAAEIGLNVKEVPSTEFKRKYGSSNLNVIKDGFRIFARIFWEFINS